MQQKSSSPKSTSLIKQLLLGYPAVMQKARKMLATASPGLQVSSLSDDQVLLHLSRIIAVRPLENVATIRFDGKWLYWREVTETEIVSISWRAVSGRSGYQDKKYQETEDKGPIPEGAWIASQGEYQQMPERSMLEQLWNEVGRGKWPGGESSWGKHRIWLTPAEGTKTYGRKGFSIHGGDEPGSAGCIDLTSQIGEFVQTFRQYGKDARLTVKYE